MRNRTVPALNMFLNTVMFISFIGSSASYAHQLHIINPIPIDCRLFDAADRDRWSRAVQLDLFLDPI